ncbi:MAG: hypothetical protein IPL23_21535 [Saprospiraceae bacterium]|nr:hypothetical protein [Saprospiraceae bacterium]
MEPFILPNDNYSATNEFNTNRDDEILLTATNEFDVKRHLHFPTKRIDFTTTIPDLVNVEEGDTCGLIWAYKEMSDEVIISPNSGLIILKTNYYSMVSQVRNTHLPWYKAKVDVA